MKANELRIGNLIGMDLKEFPQNYFKVFEVAESAMKVSDSWLSDEGDFDYYDSDLMEGIKLTEDWLIKLGFERLPHFTVTNSIIKNIGRNRVISVGSVGTPNEMIWLCEIDPFDPKHITDLVCLHNYDYDGILTVHKIQNLHFALTGEELILTKQ